MTAPETPRKTGGRRRPPGPRCRGVADSGRPCRSFAKYPEADPVWCWNCDPTKVQERADKGRIRHKAPEERKKPQPKPYVAATVDRITELCLIAAEGVRKQKLTPQQGHAMKGLFGKALDAIKARGTTGDARGLTDRDTKPEKSTPAPAKSHPSEGDIASLERALDA